MFYIKCILQGICGFCLLGAWILLALVMTGCKSKTSSHLSLFNLSSHSAQVNVGYFSMCLLSGNSSTTCDKSINTRSIPSFSMADLRSKFILPQVHPWMVVFSFCVCGICFLLAAVAAIPFMDRLPYLRLIRLYLSFFAFLSVLVTALFVHVSVSSFVMAIEAADVYLHAALGKKVVILLWISMGLLALATLIDVIFHIVSTKAEKIRQALFEKKFSLSRSSTAVSSATSSSIKK
ncbi:tetraspan protein Dni1 [Schizosaccharomyces cryophilus OY26]|uniref:Tetraspan protein Dni1 n=1 Tax=Schizosaccharomyces cryophilus (strain OY26 / ATCC MYA-4695 / CBS 11777 / NBRC 106824 / NRRL Y48691) TaxID=653667 RepID=S9W5P7_SCHCR|nr:tetraspan protein Dni1 [Schizosaccharomyces cryophilus OY26]EPY53310.1 tetraspan protein Dni1 [Schizosaccharomyces cryophilus OY26]